MKTIEPVYHIIREYAQKQEWITANSKELYSKESTALRKNIKNVFSELRDLLPEMLQIEYGEGMTKVEAQAIFEQIKQNALRRYAIELLPIGSYYKDEVQKQYIYTPQFVNWQQGNDTGFNFVVNYRESDKLIAERFVNNLIMNILLSLPAKAVHLNFVDLSLSGGYETFTKNLDESMCSKAIMGSQEFDQLLTSLIERMRSALQEYGEAIRYNVAKHAIKVPYELVVLTNYPKNYNSSLSNLSSLFENGYKGGIFFIVMNNTDVPMDERYPTLLKLQKCYQVLQPEVTVTTNEFINATPIMSHHMLAPMAFDYLSREAKRKEEMPPLIADYQSIIKQDFMPIHEEIAVPVGETFGREKVMFRLSTIGHIHSFILGQSGSGKSVFLHNVITGLIAKYSPEDLHLYLLDFKLGGVEFNRYRNEKHVKALLVDNSDIQITLEILRDISEQMRERGKALRACGVSSITDYNKANPQKRMPRILLVADECHVMFNPEGRKNLKQYNEISDIITKIAKEGRSQGVHLVLATQTLAQTEISSEILNNISDHYLLKCAAVDSEKMVRDSSEITGNLTTGQVYYHGRDDAAQFQAYFVPTKEGIELVESINKKTASIDVKDQFYFVGSQIFTVNGDVKKELANIPGNYPVASVGRSIDIKQVSVNIPLRPDDAENIMLFGIDDEDQVSETTLAILHSLQASTLSRHVDCHYVIMNFLTSNKMKMKFEKAAESPDTEIIGKREIGSFLYQLCEDLSNHNARPTVLVLLGQEKMRDLKFDNAIETDKTDVETNSDDFGFGNAFADSGSNIKYDTYRKALAYILDNGGEQGVHTVLQIDKPDKFLFDDYVTGKMLFAKFKHLIMLRSDEDAINRLNLSDDISLENLSSDPERLRAIYYNEGSDAYVLLTPYRQY